MPDKPVRIGMMSFAHMHAWSYASSVKNRRDTELAGVADHDIERATRMAQAFETHAYPSYEALVADPAIDAVIVCPENVRHRALVEMAAAAGKHVLCEKPLATTVEDARAMIAACSSAGVHLMTSFPCRFSPMMTRLKQMVDGGKPGTILAIRGTNRGRNPGGWFANPAESGGGAMIDHTVHVVDLMRWLLHDEVKTVYAETSNGIKHTDIEDVAFLSFTFQNGVFATLDASWSRSRAFPTWGDVTMEVVTTGGTLSMDMFSQNLVLYGEKNGGVSWHNWGANIDDGMVAAFVNSVLTGAPAPITGEDGLQAVSVALAAYRSAALHQPVEVAAA